MENYYLDERGIFRTESVYHDDVDFIYLVEFYKDDTKEQFKNFVEMLRKEGEKRHQNKLASMLSFIR